jgi:oxygen-independent coproporphyrinogen-3 oxidase
MARAAGLVNLSLDLMYGIPNQTCEAWRRSLESAVGTGAVHISAYELTLEPGTPLHSEVAAGRLSLPEESEVVEMYECATDLLEKAGFTHYEISNYARPGRACLHNLNYWARGEYIGAGPAAHSFTGGRRSRNISDVNAYVETLESSRLPVDDSYVVNDDEALRETVFLGLRAAAGLNLCGLGEAGLMLPDRCRDLAHAGYVETGPNFLRLTEKGMAVSNEIIVQIFRRLGL